MCSREIDSKIVIVNKIVIRLVRLVFCVNEKKKCVGSFPTLSAIPLLFADFLLDIKYVDYVVGLVGLGASARVSMPQPG